ACIAQKNCSYDCDWAGDGWCEECKGATYRGCVAASVSYNCDETYTNDTSQRLWCGIIWWGFTTDGFTCLCDTQTTSRCLNVPNGGPGLTGGTSDGYRSRRAAEGRRSLCPGGLSSRVLPSSGQQEAGATRGMRQLCEGSGPPPDGGERTVFPGVPAAPSLRR